MKPRRAEKIPATARDFFQLEAAGGLVLCMAALLALIVANTSLYPVYHYFFNEVDFRIGFSDMLGGDFELKKSILLWINDGLMVIFFYLVGLEIKRDFVHGELSSRQRAMLPVLAAIGGMILPALIYWGINAGHPAHLKGWAIPAATDIAFALGVLSLAGPRVPSSLKGLLLGIAVIDDIGAILIIALFYSHQILLPALYIAGAAIFFMSYMNRRGVRSISAYGVMTLILWMAVLQSGIHATIAGVVAAMFVPTGVAPDQDYSPAETLERDLHPWVAFGVLPIFGFANAGVSLQGLDWAILWSPVTLGIAAGLFIGKQAGVFGALLLAIKTGLCPRPEGASWRQLYAVAVLCGIGFTMSLFIGGLAFSEIEMQASVRLGVLVGSIASAVLAFFVLRAGSGR